MMNIENMQTIKRLRSLWN